MGENLKVELGLSNYATKADLKNSAVVDICKFAKNVDLARFKSENDQLDIDKLETFPVALSRLCHVVKIKLLKKLFTMN